MKSILFIGCNKSGSSREVIEVAVEMGFYTILFTDRPKFFEQRTEFTEVHEMILIDFNNLESINERIRYLQDVQGKEICTIISLIDPYVHLAAKLANEFCNSPVTASAIYAMEDKVATHGVLDEYNYTPKHMIYEKGNSVNTFAHNLNQPFPMIVKSPKSSGSKDVLLVKDTKDLEKAINRLLRNYPKEPVIIEEYLDGPQYLVEVLVWDREIYLVAIIQQEITVVNKRSIITGYSVLPEPPPGIEEGLKGAINEIVQLFQMEFGTCHLELRLVNGQWKLIEINPRISGGAMNQMILAAYGINLAKETLKVYLGWKPSLERLFEYSVFTKYLISRSGGILEKVTGKKRALSSPGVYQVYVKPRMGSPISPPRSMGNRYAYVIARGKNTQEAKTFASQALREIKLHLISL